jgi:hypothetical protein
MTTKPSTAFVPPEAGMLGFVRIVPPGDSPQAALFIRDTSATVTSFGRTPGILGRFKGMDWQRTVLMVGMIIKVRAPQAPVLYDLFLNLRDPDVSVSPFVDLAVQPKLIIQFFGDEGNPMTACMLNNPFREFARRLLKQLEEYPVWSKEQFTTAVADLKLRYPTVESLWDSLDHGSPTTPGKVE